MKMNRLIKKVIIGVAAVLSLTCLAGCNDEKAYQAALQKEIDRRIAAGELAYPGEAVFDESETTGLEGGEEQTEVMGVDLAGKNVPVDGKDVLLVDDSIVYRIGGIYPAGEYVLVADGSGSDAYYAVTMDEAGEVFVCNDSTAHTAVFNTYDGKYLRVENGKIYPIDKAPQLEKTAEGAYPEGVYKVGAQIPAGEYVVRGDSVSAAVLADLKSNSDSTIAYWSNRQCVEVIVEEGQYLKAVYGDIYPIELTEDIKPADGVYKDGMYKVGFHMPAGTYSMKADVDTAYVEIYDSNKGESIMSDQIDAEPEADFVVKEGQYVNIIGGKAVKK